VKQLSGALLRVGSWPLLANSRLGWTNLQGTNTVAYWFHSTVTKKKKVVNMVPEVSNVAANKGVVLYLAVENTLA
jgi:hypothetical protein